MPFQRSGSSRRWTPAWAGPSCAHSRSRAGAARGTRRATASGSCTRTQTLKLRGGAHMPGAQQRHLGRAGQLPVDGAVRQIGDVAAALRRPRAGRALPSSAPGACRLLRASREPRSCVPGVTQERTDGRLRASPPTAVDRSAERPECTWAQQPSAQVECLGGHQSDGAKRFGSGGPESTPIPCSQSAERRHGYVPGQVFLSIPQVHVLKS